MKAHVLKGSKHDIAESLARIRGEVREAIVFVDEPASATPATGAHDTEDIFAETLPFMVDIPNLDDSREAIYSQLKGE
jgi:hypothetical protein